MGCEEVGMHSLRGKGAAGPKGLQNEGYVFRKERRERGLLKHSGAFPYLCRMPIF